MTTISTDRIPRRRSIVFTVLLSVCLVLMAFSSNPLVREFQSGIGFAFRPIQGVLSDVAGGVASIGGGRSPRSTGCASTTARSASENERLRSREHPAAGDRPRERGADRPAAAARGFDYQTAAASVISRESSEFRRVVTIDKGDERRHQRRRRRRGRRRRARGPGDRGRTRQRDGRAPHRRHLDGHRPARVERRDGPGGRPARRRAGDGADRLERRGRPRRRGRQRRHRARRRRALAVPEGPADRPGRRHPARRERGRPDRLPAAGGGLRAARVRPGDHSTTRAACRRSRSSRSTAPIRAEARRCPRASSRASRRRHDRSASPR